MKAALLAATTICGLVLSAQAAPITYSFTNATYNQIAVNTGATDFARGVSLTISDVAVARGSFTLDISGDLPGAGLGRLTGDVADFIEFRGRDLVTPTFIRGGFLTVALAFGPGQAITSGSIRYLGQNDELNFSGSSDAFGGTFGSDQFRCNVGGQATCGVTGVFAATAVPEPATLGLLTVGLLGLAWQRRRSGSSRMT